MNPLETELKLQVPAARRAALLKAVATPAAVSTRLQAVYVDTAGRHLAAAGLALRLRKEGRVWVQTLKGRGDGIASRLEHEVRLPSQPGMPDIVVQRHAGTAAGAALEVAIQSATATRIAGPHATAGEADAARATPHDAALLPVYRTDIRRLHRRVRHAGALIEIAYDRGFIIAGDRRLAVDEIEFELISGPAAALPALAQRWSARFELWWDVRSKSERGQRLADGNTQVPAVKASAIAWSGAKGDDAAAGAASLWLAALRSSLLQALPNAAEIAEGSGTPEHLHQLRVALRRLRSVLRVLAPWSGQPDVVLALEADWRGPFGVLGAARDADVRAEALQPQLAAAGAPTFEWPDAADAIDPGECVRSGPFNALLLRTLGLMLTPPTIEAASLPDAAHAAATVLQPMWRQLLRDAAGFAAAEPELQHRTRRRLKRLRYVLEFLAPLFKRKAMGRLRRALKTAAERLGELNDLQAAEVELRQQAALDPRAWFAVGWLAARGDAAVASADAALAQLKRAPKVWRLG